MRGNLLFGLLFFCLAGAVYADPIHEAVVRGDLSRVQALLRADPALVNRPDLDDGSTPLHLAARRNRTDIVRLLLDADANLNARRNGQETPLIDAAAGNSLEAAQLLLAHGAGVNLSSTSDGAPLHIAAGNGNLDLARLLLASGADLNLHRADGWTPLHCASYWGRLDMLRLLLQRGALPTAQAANGDLPIHVAASNHQSACIGVFLALGQSIDLPNRRGDTPLIVAARNGQVNVGQYLIGAGADIERRNEAGRNAMEEAVRANQTPFVVLLRRYQTALAERDERDQARTLAGRALRTGYLNWAAPFVQTTPVYHSDFGTGQTGQEWSALPAAGALPLAVSTTPKGARRFLGEFGNQAVRLTLDRLPPHAEVSIRFDLYVLRAWQGNDLYVGPHLWSLSADNGPPLFSTTFANALTIESPKIRMQSYPAEYPGGHNAIRTGAAEVNTLGYTGDLNGQVAPMDSVYPIRFTFPHTASALALTFAAQGLEAQGREGWGITGVQVSLALPTAPPKQTSVATAPPPRPSSHPAVRRVFHPRVRSAVSHPIRRKKAATPSPVRRPATRLHPKERPPGL